MTKRSTIRSLTEYEAAKVGLWLDDPYGDGIRLECIREPSVSRQATLDFVASGQRTLDGYEQDYIKRGRSYAANKAAWKNLVLQGVVEE